LSTKALAKSRGILSPWAVESVNEGGLVVEKAKDSRFCRWHQGFLPKNGRRSARHALPSELGRCLLQRVCLHQPLNQLEDCTVLCAVPIGWLVWRHRCCSGLWYFIVIRFVIGLQWEPKCSVLCDCEWCLSFDVFVQSS
jgi:hypothetical protein